MSSEFWRLFLTGLGLQIVIMGCTWAFGRAIKNYSVVDTVWSFSFPLHMILFSAMGEGWVVRKALLLLMTIPWGVRLGVYIATRTYRHHPEEDPRYLELRAEYGERASFRFFLFIELQAFIVSMLTVPFILCAINPNSELSVLEIFGCALWFICFAGEVIADGQKRAFRQDPANKNDFCRVGLWKYSRHPNYFFENGIWWSFFVFALSSPGGVFTVYGPLFMLLLLVKVSGIAMTERYEVNRFGDRYREYQRTTSALVPWRRKV